MSTSNIHFRRETVPIVSKYLMIFNVSSSFKRLLPGHELQILSGTSRAGKFLKLREKNVYIKHNGSREDTFNGLFVWLRLHSSVNCDILNCHIEICQFKCGQPISNCWDFLFIDTWNNSRIIGILLLVNFLSYCPVFVFVWRVCLILFR